MSMKKKKYWFKAKKYGWGWYPYSWEGYSVLGLYVTILMVLFYNIDIYSTSATDTLNNFFPQMIVVTIILFVICFIKGEKPRWRWGD